MRLAGTRSADEHDILSLVQELAAVQRSDHRFIDHTVIEGKTSLVAMGRKACDFHLVVDGSDLTVSDFGRDQLVQQNARLVTTIDTPDVSKSETKRNRLVNDVNRLESLAGGAVLLKHTTTLSDGEHFAKGFGA